MEKETTPTHQNVPPLYRGEFTTCSLWRGSHRAKREKETTPTNRNMSPLCRGELPLIHLSEGCPKGGVGEKKPPRQIRICHPSCRGEFTSYSPLRRAARRAGWEEETTPTNLNLSPICRGEFTTCSLWKAAHMAGWKKKPPRHIRICHPSIEGNLPLFRLSEGCP